MFKRISLLLWSGALAASPVVQADAIIDRLGEPYLSTRARDPEATEQAGGLGLGIFIAKTLLERTGARLAFANESPEGHARVRIVWPRKPLQDGNFDLSAPNA